MANSVRITTSTGRSFSGTSRGTGFSVQLREAFEALGYRVSWEANTRTVTVNGHGHELTFRIGRREYQIRDTSTNSVRNLTLRNSAPLLVDGRTILTMSEPLRAMGYTVQWTSGHTVFVGVPARDRGGGGNTNQRMMDNLRNLPNRRLTLSDGSTQQIESVRRRDAMVRMGQELLGRNNQPAFVAGILANIMREGNFGEFENIRGLERGQHFIDNHDYNSRFSRLHIYDEVTATLQYIRNMITNSPRYRASPNNSLFGLGCMQWTNGIRIIPLIDRYIAAAQSDGRITSVEQVSRAEIDTLTSDIAGIGNHTGPHPDTGTWGFDLRALWRDQNRANLNSESAARSAGDMITRLLQRPDNVANEATLRGNLAVAIYRVMSN